MAAPRRAPALHEHVKVGAEHEVRHHGGAPCFVHVDVRDRSTYWVDWSRPGESPVYQRRGEAPPSDATDAERSAVGEGGDDVDEDEAGDAGEDAAAAGTEDAAEEPIDDAPAEE